MNERFERILRPLIFVLVTLLLALAAYGVDLLIRPRGVLGYLGGVFVSACASLLAVAFALTIWAAIGGDPVFDAMRKIALITNDVMPNGVQRLWLDRNVQKTDPQDGREVWMKRLEAATDVDLMGNSLSSSWLSKGNCKELAETLQTNPKKTVRVIIYDSESPFAKGRAAAEKRNLLKDIEDTKAISEKYERQFPERWMCRSCRAHYLPMHYVRADDLMLVCFYSLLPGEGGKKAFSMQLRSGALFSKFEEQFEKLWAELYCRQAPSSTDTQSGV
jgi:hypothetical protein